MTAASPRVRPWTRRLRYGWAIEAGLGVGLYLLFDELRSRAAGAGPDALRHALDLVHWEHSLGLYQEHRVQRAFIAWPWFLTFWNFYYGTIHFVMPVVALVTLWRRDPRRYVVWRNILLLMLAIGLVLFALYPLMPPRLMPAHYGFTDTAAAFYNFGPQQRVVMVHDVPTAASLAAFGNLFAAMPSFHAGWSMWSALALYPVVRRRWVRALVVAYPACTLFAIVVTANHWILDAVGGWAVLLVAWATVTAWERWRHPVREAEPADAVPEPVAAQA